MIRTAAEILQDLQDIPTHRDVILLAANMADGQGCYRSAEAGRTSINESYMLRFNINQATKEKLEGDVTEGLISNNSSVKNRYISQTLLI